MSSFYLTAYNTHDGRIIGVRVCDGMIPGVRVSDGRVPGARVSDGRIPGLFGPQTTMSTFHDEFLVNNSARFDENACQSVIRQTSKFTNVTKTEFPD